MTFEEAIKKINNLFIEPCIPGYSNGDFAPEFLGQIEDLEEIIEELQETYAPKIKMTKVQFDWFEEAREKYKNLEGIYIALHFGDEKSKGISFEMLMQSWLHPELIEEVENDI